jgi:hypothetical protein
MKSEYQSNQLQFLAPSFREICNPDNPLLQLAERIDWTEIEAWLSHLYMDIGSFTGTVESRIALFSDVTASVAG